MPFGKNVFWSHSCKLLYSDHDSFLSKPQLHSHSQRYDLWMLNWWLNEAHLMWDFACTSKTMIMMIMKNINTVVLWPLRPASLMHKNPPKCTNIYGSVPCRTQRSIDRSEDVFCRIPCLCDFCGYSSGHCWTMHNIIFFKTLLCFTKEYLLSTWSHKGPSIFQVRTSCFLNWDSMVLEWDSKFFTRWAPGLTIHVTICGKITDKIKLLLQ